MYFVGGANRVAFLLTVLTDHFSYAASQGYQTLVIALDHTRSCTGSHILSLVLEILDNRVPGTIFGARG